MTIRHLIKSEYTSYNSSTPLCVIGGGIAGLIFARRIAQSGKRVVVLESGYTSFDATIHKLNEIEDPSGRYTRALDGRYRGLGGSSSQWGGRFIPISEHERHERAYIAQPGWPLGDRRVDSYGQALEHLFGIDQGPYDGGEVRNFEGADFFSGWEEDISTRWAKCPPPARCNLKTVLRNELKRLAPLEIWLGATVCDFDLDRESGRLAGITARSFDGKTLKVTADRFIFAAGAIETTRLLLLLDERSDHRAFSGCNVLGAYFQDHLKAKVATIDRRNADFTNRIFAYRFVNSTRRDLHLELSEHAQRKDAVASAFAYVAMDFAASPLSDLRRITRGIQRGDVALGDVARLSRNLGLLTRSAYWRFVKKQLFAPPDIDFDLMVCAEQLPCATNRISLSEARDAFGLRKARFEWAPRPADERTFRSAISHLAAYWRKSGLERFSPLRWRHEAVDPSRAIIEQAEACAHPSGSTRMGTDPAQSVVGADLRCHAVPNVAVASASVFPTAGSANPTFTIMKLALWLADSYLESAAGQDFATPLGPLAGM